MPAVGNVNRISVPLPTVLDAYTVPLCASTVCRAIARPSPVPPGLLVTYGSQILARRSAGIQQPESRTEMTMPSSPL